jgi:hypothetical protein
MSIGSSGHFSTGLTESGYGTLYENVHVAEYVRVLKNFDCRVQTDETTPDGFCSLAVRNAFCNDCVTRV